MPKTQHEKAQAFRALHEGETFIIPNPWDAGSAKAFAGKRSSGLLSSWRQTTSGAASSSQRSRTGRRPLTPLTL